VREPDEEKELFMIRNLKVLMLAVMVSAAVSAVGASAAQAVPLFNSEAESTILKGTQDGTGKTAHYVFDFAGATLTCNEVHVVGNQAGKSAELVTLTAEYTGCVFAGQAATIKMEACDFRFHANGDFDIHKHTNSPGNCKHHEQGITINIPGCKIIVPEQTGLKSIKYHNIIDPVSGKKVLTVEPLISNITYDSTGVVCPTQPAGTYADGTITTNNLIIKGTNSVNGVPVNIEWTP
jgi:hypothetical protein